MILSGKRWVKLATWNLIILFPMLCLLGMRYTSLLCHLCTNIWCIHFFLRINRYIYSIYGFIIFSLLYHIWKRNHETKLTKHGRESNSGVEHERKVASSCQRLSFLAYFHQRECSRRGQSGWIHLLHKADILTPSRRRLSSDKKIAISSYVSNTQTNCLLARTCGYLHCFRNEEHKASNHCQCC